MGNGFRDLKIWQEGKRLVVQVYQMTETFPKCEEFGLKSQMRRAGVSIPSNIAEGWGRMGSKEFVHFVRIARGSALELQTQIEIALDLGYLCEEDATFLLQDLDSLCQTLYLTVKNWQAPRVKELTTPYGHQNGSLSDLLAEDDLVLAGLGQVDE